MLITKLSGETEQFSHSKLQRSLTNAGAPPERVKAIVREVEKGLKKGVTTQEIYRRAFSLLKREKGPFAARYSLKRAIFELGPHGYPFEKFIGKLLERKGYKVEIGKYIRGKCVTHEVDVVAKKENKHFLIESKFHNRQGTKSDVKVALYIKARFDDIQSKLKNVPGHTVFHQVWLITNTKFTSNAIRYANCVHMKMTGWNYPKRGGLEDLIEQSGLHPLTAPTSLSSPQKKALLNKGIVLCREIIEKPRLLKEIGLRGDKHQRVIEEIESICSV
ncbi:MAG: ATP cone domain-containing protein [Patescibacteria group bacterium]|nr:ATP cone domain-containing protein [Patescibacteria group bacterium]